MTVISKLLDAKDEEMAKFLMKQEKIFPPPIPFKSKAKRGKLIAKKDSSDKQEKARAKLNLHTATLQYDNTEDSATYTHDVEKFASGSGSCSEKILTISWTGCITTIRRTTNYGANKVSVLKAVLTGDA